MSLVRSWEYAIMPLSPVHVGSGEALSRHEFTVEGDRLTRYDVDAFLKLLAVKGEDLLDRYVTQGLEAVRDWLSREELDRCVLYRTAVSGNPRQVREQIADGLGRVYLPGSSLKGAIRTALAWSYLQEGHAEGMHERALQGERREWAGQALMNEILGENPNLDLLRALRVFDSTPLSRDHLAVVETKVAALENGRLLWFAGPHRPKQPKIERGVSTFVECFPPLASSAMEVAVEADEFLLHGATHRGEPHPSEPPRALKLEERRKLLANWQGRCNEFARHVAEGEIAFAKEAALPQYKAFHEQRLREIRAVSNPEEKVFLIIGWGGGWRSKTVTEAFDEETVREIRKRYGLEAYGVHRGCGGRVREDNRVRGAYFCPRCKRGGLQREGLDWRITTRYPKTRKIVVEGNRPIQPLGWVRLTLKGVIS